LAASASGSSNRIVAALMVLEPPSASAGEVTEKGTINGRLLQRNRPELLETLFSAQFSELVVHQSESRQEG
jgi:feruloyl-CoA synthase